jgi:hypothetical protein
MALDPISAALDIGGKVIDRLWPDPAQAAAAKLELVKMQQSGELAQLMADTDLAKAQIGVNAVEAASSDAFTSRGRPFIIWVCGFALLYASILDPLARFVAMVIFKYVGAFPVIDTTITLQVLFGLLGLGAMRSYDKKNGTAS